VDSIRVDDVAHNIDRLQWPVCQIIQGSVASAESRPTISGTALRQEIRKT
jgi:hypothetical protein